MNSQHERSVFLARLICSDQGCAETFEIYADTLAELATLACYCDCGLQVLGVAESVEVEADVDVLVAFAHAA